MSYLFMVVTRVIHISIDDADDIIELAAIVQQVLHELGYCDCPSEVSDADCLEKHITDVVEELV